VITEDEATRLLKRADPARVDDSAPFVDAAGYLAALRTRSTTMTLIDTEPTPTRPEHRHRWPIIAVAAAAVVAVVVGGLVLATRDDDPNEQIPAATTVAPDPDASAAEAEEVARGFVDAFVAGDADRALTYLADDVIATEDRWGSPEGFRRDIAWQEAARYEWNVHDCQRHDGATEVPRPLDDPAASGQSIGTIVRCGLDFHVLGSNAIGLGPYDISWDLAVHNGKVVWVNGAEGQLDWTPQFEGDLWGGGASFAKWIRTEHPDDVLVMYQDSSQDWPHTTDEALRLWEQRTEEFVQAVLTGRESYPADVGAVCATQAAQLAELTVPAEGALDQVAAWNAAATAMEQAHQELTALDRPPATDTTAHTNFYGRLFRLVRIAEDSAAAATAGDSTRLAELNAEYLEVRQSMSSGPAGSGLEECLASLPS
jgi:hypothetical protein